MESHATHAGMNVSAPWAGVKIDRSVLRRDPLRWSGLAGNPTPPVPPALCGAGRPVPRSNRISDQTWREESGGFGLTQSKIFLGNGPGNAGGLPYWRAASQRKNTED